MTPVLAATDGSYYLATCGKLYIYAFVGTFSWVTPDIGSSYCIAVETSGVYVGVTSSSSYYVKKFNRNNGNVMWTSSSLNSYIYALAVNSNTVIVADYNYKIYRLNPSNGSTVYTYTIPNNRYAYALAIEPGTNHFTQ